MKLFLYQTACVDKSVNHGEMVHCLCWNPFRNELLSMSDNKCLTKWNLKRKNSNRQRNHSGSGNMYMGEKVFEFDVNAICCAWCPNHSQALIAVGFTNGCLQFIQCSKNSNVNMNNNNNNAMNVKTSTSNSNQNEMKVKKSLSRAHKGCVTCIAWNSDGSSLITGGEDGVIKQWSQSGNLRSKLISLPNAVHCVCWSPNTNANQNSIAYATNKYIGLLSVQGQKQQNSNKNNSSGGGANMNNKNNAIKWKAHNGLVLCFDWNSKLNTNLIVSGGEDGCYRVWDEFGRLMYASKVFDYPITCVQWSPNGQSFVVSCSNLLLLCNWQGWIMDEINIDCISSSLSSLPRANHHYGGNSSQNTAASSSASSASASASASSIYCLQWRSDGKQIGIGCNNSHDGQQNNVVIGVLTNITKYYGQYIAQLNVARNRITLKDIFLIGGAGSGGGGGGGHQNAMVDDHDHHGGGGGGGGGGEEYLYETLEFENEIILEFSLDYNYLVVITKQLNCHIFNLDSLNTPHIISIRNSFSILISTIIQTANFFALISSMNICVYSYDDGQILNEWKLPQSKLQLLNANNFYVTDDILAMVNVQTFKAIDIFMDPLVSNNGNLNRNRASFSIQHSNYIYTIAMSCSANPISSYNRILSFIDCNRDLFLVSLTNESNRSNSTDTRQIPAFKLNTIVDSMIWHQSCDILLVLSDKQLLVYYYPSIVWCDPQLLPFCIEKVDIQNMGNFAKIVSVHQSLVTIRESNGNQICVKFSPLILSLYRVLETGEWKQALKLCYICNQKHLWAAIAGLAIDHSQIEIAIQALTELKQSEKLFFLQKAHLLPLTAQKEAELALYKKNVARAENILLENSLVFRAIELNLRLMKWEQALKLALDYNKCAEIVIAFRNVYLMESTNDEQENIELFLNLNMEEYNVKWEHIQNVCRQEIESEFRASNTQYNQNMSVHSFCLQKCKKYLRNKTHINNDRQELEQLLGIYNNSNNNSSGSSISNSMTKNVVHNDYNDTDEQQSSVLDDFKQITNETTFEDIVDDQETGGYNIDDEFI